jgi:hypothetical protein
MSQNTFTINNFKIELANTVIIVTEIFKNEQYISEYKKEIVFGPSYFDDTLRETILSCINNNNIKIECTEQPILFINNKYCNIYESNTYKLLLRLPSSTNYYESGRALHKLLCEKHKNNKRQRDESDQVNNRLKEENDELKEEIKKLKTVHNNMDCDSLLKSFEFEFDKLNREIEFLKQDNKNLNNDYKTIKELDDVVICDLINKSKEKQYECDILKDEIKDLNDFIASLQDDISNYNY